MCISQFSSLNQSIQILHGYRILYTQMKLLKSFGRNLRHFMDKIPLKHTVTIIYRFMSNHIEDHVTLPLFHY